MSDMYQHSHLQLLQPHLNMSDERTEHNVKIVISMMSHFFDPAINPLLSAALLFLCQFTFSDSAVSSFSLLSGFVIRKLDIPC